MTKTKDILNHITFALQILLLFLLVFESYLELPKLLQSFGRMHPLLLHLPIGMLVLLVLFWFAKREIPLASYFSIQSFSIHIIAFFSVITAVIGLFLSQEAAYESSLTNQHKWTGVSFNFVTYAMLIWHNRFPERQTFFNFLMVVGLILLIIAGHLGGSITHGADFVIAPIKEKKSIEITDTTTVFNATIQPTLEAKCYNCHNQNKSKGELIMTSAADLMKGGEHGAIWMAGNPDSSHIMQRLYLPLADELHMPPKGKPQLTETEVKVFYEWIKNGADFKLTLGAIQKKDTLNALVQAALSQHELSKVEKQQNYTFDFADAEVIETLNTPFCNISPIAYNSPALQAEIFVRSTYEPSFLKSLAAIKEQLVSLNLSNLPINDEDLFLIAQFPNLEKLTLNGTDITGATLHELKQCQNLKQIALSSTAITALSLKVLQDFPALENVYVWNTAISVEDAAASMKSNPKLKIGTGFVPDKNELLKLSPPIFKTKSTVVKKEELVVLETKFPGAIIRYTTDGSEPDSSQAPIYEKPISINNATTIKARTFSENWLGSDVASFTLFPEGFQPDSVILLAAPNDQYKGDGAITLTDKQKGEPNNFRNKAWLGYRDNNLKALIDFGNAPPVINKIVSSFAQNIGPEIFPPAKILVWGGDSPRKMELLSKKSPDLPTEYISNEILGITLEIPSTKYQYYQIEIEPIQQVPRWHQNYKSGRKGWMFIDEIFFY